MPPGQPAGVRNDKDDHVTLTEKEPTRPADVPEVTPGDSRAVSALTSHRPAARLDLPVAPEGAAADDTGHRFHVAVVRGLGWPSTVGGSSVDAVRTACGSGVEPSEPGGPGEPGEPREPGEAGVSDAEDGIISRRSTGLGWPAEDGPRSTRRHRGSEVPEASTAVDPSEVPRETEAQVSRDTADGAFPVETEPEGPPPGTVPGTECPGSECPGTECPGTERTGGSRSDGLDNYGGIQCGPWPGTCAGRSGGST